MGKSMPEYRLELSGFNKSFPGVQALQDVSLRVKPGSVHALVGENGAGKSTLMKCLFGIYRPDAGNILLDGAEVHITETLDAIKQGIAMIHQELNYIPERSVQDNIWLGRYEKKGIVVDEQRMYEKTETLLKQVEFSISPKVIAKKLSVSQLQAIEIAKAISYNARVIIMDEPTSSLTTSETQHLFKLIRQFRNDGISIVYISHKLEEIFDIADEVTIMRDGVNIGSWPVAELSIPVIIGKMVGRNLDNRFPGQITKPLDEVILKVENLSSLNPKSFQDICFDLRKGEILGIGGLVGAQRTEMVESLFGLRHIVSGAITKDGKKIQIKSPEHSIRAGFALLTEERRMTGIISQLSVEDNVLVASYKKFANKFKIVRKKEAYKAAKATCENLQVKTPSMKSKIVNLSGGNQQKVLFARWLITNPDILILDEPTRGIDVGAKHEIYKLMRELVARGNSIIMVSSEMPELIGMSDRILVMCSGKATGILDKDEVTQERIMELATKFG
jgi:methyl-galactoside transport system ATP-binding protein